MKSELYFSSLYRSPEVSSCWAKTPLQSPRQILCLAVPEPNSPPLLCHLSLLQWPKDKCYLFLPPFLLEAHWGPRGPESLRRSFKRLTGLSGLSPFLLPDIVPGARTGVLLHGNHKDEGPQGRGKFRGNGPSGAEPPDPCHRRHFSVSCRVSQVHRKAASLVSCYFQPNTFPNPCPLAQLLGLPQRVCFSFLSLCNKPPESITAYKATTTICFAHKPVIWTALCGDGLSLFQAVSAGEVQQGTKEYASRWFTHSTSLSGQLAGENGGLVPEVPVPQQLPGLSHNLVAGL